MGNHKFRLGQKVIFVGKAGIFAAGGEYEIVKLLPAESGQIQYRLKSRSEAYERVAREDQLDLRGG